MELDKIYCGDCLDLMEDVPDNSIDCIICDLPYFEIVEAYFDNQWKDEKDYLHWIENVVLAYKRVLRSGGNIFLFYF